MRKGGPQVGEYYNSSSEGVCHKCFKERTSFTQNKNLKFSWTKQTEKERI